VPISDTLLKVEVPVPRDRNIDSASAEGFLYVRDRDEPGLSAALAQITATLQAKRLRVARS
jgi:hypothetical protein